MAFFQMDNNQKKALNAAQDYELYCKSTFRQAEEYFILSVNAAQYVFHDAVSAITSNIAFACELYLKCILLYEGQKVSGHYLDNLFGKIQSEDIKSRIKTRIADENFDLSLQEIRKAFEVARYVNEYTVMTCNMQFLVKFMESLREECKDLLEMVDNA